MSSRRRCTRAPAQTTSQQQKKGREGETTDDDNDDDVASSLQRQQLKRTKKKEKEKAEEQQQQQQQQQHEEVNETLTNVFQGYETKSLPFETDPHPCKVVESSSLSAVALPKLTYPLVPELIQNKNSSGLQLEGVAFACQKHQDYLEDGERRAGFFIGDGAGIGKGRQIAGVIFDNYCRGRRRHVWVSTSIDLARDAQRDRTDVGCHESHTKRPRVG